MSRRIEIELTSDRGDGTWTWRAAGARQPKGVVAASLLPEGAKTGDVLRAEVEIELDGVTVQSVASGPPRARTEPERIELLGPPRRDDEQLVTSQLVGRRDRGDRGDRGDRPRRPRRDGEGRPDRRPGEGRDGRPGGDRPRGDRPEGDRPPRRDRPARAERPDGERRERRERRPAPPPLPERPKPKRLRPGRAHRKAVLADVAPEQQPIAEQVLKGGIPAVRQAIDAENEVRAGRGEPPIAAQELLAIAEQLLPRLRTADWRDRAEAALAEADELDLRDLRSVVVAADAAARDDETRAMAADLRAKLEQRVESEQANWLEDMQLALSSGRVVRALRLSSRPPKAGTILPPDLRASLVEAAGAALTADIGADRWGAVLDALAYAPVKGDVKPASVPEQPSDEVLATIKKYAARVPGVGAAFGIEAPPRPAGRSLRPPKPPRRPGTVPVPKRAPAPTTIGTPVESNPPAEDLPAGAQAAPAAVEPDAADAAFVEATAAPETPGSDAGAPAPAPGTAPSAGSGPEVEPPAPAQEQAATDAPPAPAQEQQQEQAAPDQTTDLGDVGVAEAATPAEETGALDAAQDDPAEAVTVPPDATPEGPSAEVPAPEAAATSEGMPEAAMPVEADPSAGAAPGAAEAALEAAPDADEVSEG